MKHILVLLLLVATAQPVLRVPLLPVDEAKTDTSLAAFRERLVHIARLRDLEALRKLTASTVALRFGPASNEALRKELFPESEVWDRLVDLLQLGGSFTSPAGERRRFCAPYVYSRFPALSALPEGYIDEVRPWAILGTDVAVRSQPDLQAPVITRVSHELVRYLARVGPADGYRPSWVEVLTPNGERGFVHGSLIRSPGDYHACFERFDAGWLMVEFLEDPE